MKFCDPKFGDAKSEGKFLYMDIVKKLLKWLLNIKRNIIYCKLDYS
jgi:hypothetical protein